jgi:O-antigen ligase
MWASRYLDRFFGLTLAPPVFPPAIRQLAWPTFVLVTGICLAWFPLRLAVVAAGGAIFLILTLLYPILTLYLLIPVIPFSSLLALPLGGARAGLMELLLLLAAGLWLVHILSSATIRGRPYIVRTGPLLLPFLIFLGGIGFSWLNALSIRASFIETIKWVEVFFLYLFIVNLLVIRQIKWVVLTIIFAGTAQAILGIYQFIFKVGPEGFLLFGGNFLRAYGTFAQPNPYAGYLGLVLPLAISVLIWGLFESPPNHKGTHHRSQSLFLLSGYYLSRTVLYGLPVVLMMVALFASQSRGAWIGFFVAGITTIIVRSRKAASILLAGFLLLMVVTTLSWSTAATQANETDSFYVAMLQRFANAGAIFNVTDVATTPVTDANFATIERLAHWQAAQEMWRDHLWLGVGFGNYATIYPAYAVGRWLDPLGHAHNYLLNIGAEAGLVGTIVYLIFWIWVFGVSWVIVRRSSGFLRAVAAGAIGMFVHLQIHNIVDNLYVQGMYLLVAIVLGLVSLIYIEKSTHRFKTVNSRQQQNGPRYASD